MSYFCICSSRHLYFGRAIRDWFILAIVDDPQKFFLLSLVFSFFITRVIILGGRSLNQLIQPILLFLIIWILIIYSCFFVPKTIFGSQLTIQLIIIKFLLSCKRLWCIRNHRFDKIIGLLHSWLVFGGQFIWIITTFFIQKLLNVRNIIIISFITFRMLFHFHI